MEELSLEEIRDNICNINKQIAYLMNENQFMEEEISNGCSKSARSDYESDINYNNECIDRLESQLAIQLKYEKDILSNTGIHLK